MRWERASLFNFEFTNGGKTTAEQILRPEDRTKSKKKMDCQNNRQGSE